MSIQATCAGCDKVLKPIADGCKVVSLPSDTGTEHERRFIRIARPDYDGAKEYFTHHDCIHNQTIALRNRVIGEVPKPTLVGLANLRKQLKLIKRLLPRVIPDDYFVMPAMYSGLKRLRYTRATEQVLDEGVTKRDARIKMFVKFEKLLVDQKKINPDPRAIQFRDPKYCVEIARFLKPCEHAIYQLQGDGIILPKSRLIGKGLSMSERGNLLNSKLRRFRNPRIISLDAARFDQHVDVELLKLEHSIYLYMCGDLWFEQLLSWQLKNYGLSSRGIRYITKGKRMSGDMNTALGNCLLMILMVSTFMVGRDYDLLDDGDDCLLIIEVEDLPWVESNIVNAFLSYGHEIKVENVASKMEEVQWCQSRPVMYSPGRYKFVRDVDKVVSASLIGGKYVDSDKSRRKLINTIGMGELILNLGIPVLQSYAMSLMRNADTPDIIVADEVDDGLYFRVHRELRRMNLKQLVRVDPQPINIDARLSFAAAFNMDISKQLSLEKFFDSWSFPISGCEFLPSELDVVTWLTGTIHSPEVAPIWE